MSECKCEDGGCAGIEAEDSDLNSKLADLSELITLMVKHGKWDMFSKAYDFLRMDELYWKYFNKKDRDNMGLNSDTALKYSHSHSAWLEGEVSKTAESYVGAVGRNNYLEKRIKEMNSVSTDMAKEIDSKDGIIKDLTLKLRLARKEPEGVESDRWCGHCGVSSLRFIVDHYKCSTCGSTYDEEGKIVSRGKTVTKGKS